MKDLGHRGLFNTCYFYIWLHTLLNFSYAPEFVWHCCSFLAFGHKGSFKKHMLATHGIELTGPVPEDDSYIYTCLSCNNTFNSYETLQTHQVE